MKARELKEELIKILAASDKVKGVGQTGNISAELIPGKSDIDLFVICTEIPTQEERKSYYTNLRSAVFSLQMEVCSGGIWGYGDTLLTDGIEVMPMYFTVNEMRDYLKEVLACKHLDKAGRFYPVGRLASVSTIHILYERDAAWTELKDMVNAKPTIFFKSWFEREISQVLDDEDLGRAELRKEILFFHQVLEEALDHILQALFAMNFSYFPSRKRTIETIENLQYKPADCAARLLAMVQNGASSDTIVTTIEELRFMTQEIYEIGTSVFENRK